MISHKNGTVRLVDVGCRGGIHPRWRSLGKDLQVIGLDIDDTECAELKDIVYFPTILYSRKGTIKFYVTADKNCSSVYPPNLEFMKKFIGSDHLVVEKIVDVECNTLDNFLEHNDIEDIDFLKIDAQGAELDVLKGSEKTLENVVGIECEVEFSPIYFNQPLFADIDSFLRSRDFILYDLEFECRYLRNNNVKSKGQVLYAVALYFKDENKLNSSKIGKAITIARLYGFNDLASDLLEHLEKRI